MIKSAGISETEGFINWRNNLKTNGDGKNGTFSKERRRKK